MNVEITVIAMITRTDGSRTERHETWSYTGGDNPRFENQEIAHLVHASATKMADKIGEQP